MAVHVLPPQSVLRDRFDYDPVTGSLTWKKKNLIGFKMSGKLAGSICRSEDGVVVGWAVNLDGKTYRRARLIWMWVYGSDPGDLEVDHKDRNPINESIDNLRLATKSQNCSNQRCRSDSSSGLRGAIKLTLPGGSIKWRAVLTVKGVRRCLGTFDTAEEAHSCYRSHSESAVGEFACFAPRGA